MYKILIAILLLMPTVNYADDFSDYEQTKSMTCVGSGGSIRLSWDGVTLRLAGLVNSIHRVDGKTLKKKKGKNVFILRSVGFIDFDSKKLILSSYKVTLPCF